METVIHKFKCQAILSKKSRSCFSLYLEIIRFRRLNNKKHFNKLFSNIKNKMVAKNRICIFVLQVCPGIRDY